MRMSIWEIIKKIFVGILKMNLRVFLRRKLFGEISVEYLGSISRKNLKGSFGNNLYVILKIILVRI
jgi:hypothetical protein